jgi:single-strand DNA-binding protein
MAGSVNKVILIGNTGRDPELRYLENGVPVATVTLATSESYVDKKTGEKRELTDWHNVVFWRGLAEVVNTYVKKGMKIYVEGRLRTRSYTDKDNVVRYITEIVADELQMLSPRSNDVSEPTKPNYPPTVEEPKPIPPISDMHKDEDIDMPF